MIRKKGFTLVELLVVVAIIAILVAVLTPVYTQYAERAREARAQADLANINKALTIHAVSDGNYPGAYGPNSIADILQQHGIKWTGDDNGVKDPWGNPYIYIPQ